VRAPLRAHKLACVCFPPGHVTEITHHVDVMADEFSALDGTLTPTLKLRRRAIEERYREQINEPY
jgi:long-subunit acyl-CoA synthetase (AMP-forming)